MQYIGSVKIVTELPAELRRLNDLAYNVYYSWVPQARQVFRLIDPELWTQVNHNPIKFLREVTQKDLQRVSADPVYLNLFNRIMKDFDEYLAAEDTWYAKTFPKDKDDVIAYFSAEFGLHESLPIYSGGLGVLAGDHIKAASDLGLPLVGLSLFYHQTYFTQQIDAHGQQLALYVPHQGSDLPLRPVVDEKGNRRRVAVDVAQRLVVIQAWELEVGRTKIYLLDTNLPENNPEDRMITSRLYGGDQEMRISQEIVLGMGGVLLLEQLGIEPVAWHMNEGHSVFLALERIRGLVRNQGLEFYDALEAVAAGTIFTTHTPVPAGNDAFPLHFMDKYFQKYWESVGIRRYQFMELGSQLQPEGYEIFNLTILSLKLSRFRNGVSKLHGEVSREMWKDVWPGIPVDEIPIQHITNGVHHHTWMVYPLTRLFEKYLGKDWSEHIDQPVFWKGVLTIPDDELWEIRRGIKEKMLNHLRARLETQHIRNKVGTLSIQRLKEMLDPNILTIGFARRFATYKRGTLIFRDKERLRRILNHPERPVQLIFSGKSHPKDKGGQELIRQISELSMSEEFKGRVFFIENYDMSLARDLISGVDVWLNNPRRPQEASGTSGQKVGMNGGINFSVMDGWWCEGYNGINGFAFGDREDYIDLDELDSWDSDAIYDILENDLLPLYYSRNENGLPVDWLRMVKESIISVAPQFNTHRMVKDYTNQLYRPAIKLGKEFSRNRFAIASEFTEWRNELSRAWSSVSLELDAGFAPDFTSRFDEPLTIRVAVDLGSIKPSEVKVQLYLAHADAHGRTDNSPVEYHDMSKKKTRDDGVYIYEAAIQPSDSGHYRYTARVLPNGKKGFNPVELGLVRWLEHK